MLKKTAVSLIVFLSPVYFIIFVNASDCGRAKSLLSEGNKIISRDASKNGEVSDRRDRGSSLLCEEADERKGTDA